MKRLIFRTDSGFNVKLNQHAPAAILTKTTLKCIWRLVQFPNHVAFLYSNSNWISMSFPKNFWSKITCKNKALKICEDWAQLIFRVVSAFFRSKKLGLHEFVLFKLSQTHEQSISCVHFKRKGDHIIPLTPKKNFSEKKRCKLWFFPNAWKYRKKWEDWFLELVHDFMWN